MLLTKRDLEIFAIISRCAILTTSQLSKTVFKGIAKTTVLRRLRKLEKAKFIERIEGLANYEKAWALTAKGAEAIGYPPVSGKMSPRFEISGGEILELSESASKLFERVQGSDRRQDRESRESDDRRDL